MHKNIFIYFTAFFCGMTVMAVELSATRLLAPYFGTSMIIWTIVVGMILVALSLGNYLGGRIADKYHTPDRLYFWIWIAAFWIGMIPLVGKYIITFVILMMAWLLPEQLLVAGTVFSCLIIFSCPLVLLGMAPPYLIKLGVSDTEHNGRTTGVIYALSTTGSIIGTLIPTFITIPAAGIGTSKTFLIFGLIINLLCLYYFVIIKKQAPGRIILTGGVILGLLIIPINTSYAFWKHNIREEESPYNYLQIYRENGAVILSTHVAFGIQSIYRRGTALSGLYYDYLLMAPLFCAKNGFRDRLDILILGLGAGTYAKQSRYYFPNSRIDGVDIDPKIIRIARENFDLSDRDARIYISDGRTFLSSNAAKKYDLIMIDAYHDITIPFHMATREFFTQAKQHLNPNGVIAVNINIHSKSNPELINYFSQTIKAELRKVYRCDIGSLSNTILFASDNTECWSNFLANVNRIEAAHPLGRIAGYVKNRITEVHEKKLLLTDEVAPVELMGQKVLDEYVANGLSYFRNRLKNSGNKFRELINIALEAN